MPTSNMNNDQGSNITSLNIENGEIGFQNSREQFCIRMIEVPRLQSHFNVFYLNKLQYNGKLLEHKKDV